MRGKKFFAVMMAAVTVFTLSGCSSGQPEQTTAQTQAQPAGTETPAQTQNQTEAQTPAQTTAAGASGQITYATIVRSVDDYCAALAKGGEEICAEFGWKALTFNSESDVQTQLDCIQSCISQGVDGIYIHETDAVAIAPMVKKALDAGIHITTSSILREPLGDYGDHENIYYVFWDNELAGYNLAKQVIEKMGGEGELLIITPPIGLNITTILMNGVHRAVAEYPNIKVVNEIDSNNDRTLALNITEDALTANPDIDGIVCLSEISAWGCVEAIENLGFEGIVIGTTDNSKVTMQMVIDGRIDVCTGCPAATGTIVGAKILKQKLAGLNLQEIDDIMWIDFENHLANCDYNIYDQSNADLKYCDY